ncbi:AmmeMemoRadiSam system radical SAM enzyme [Prolixibacter sp. SD074]|uniref:AmmeMemoRadiSam system radical SAM enzyme n=1 Tax=Prolixibacter sp. SD074 TaxID=2652391 RepID=UPI0012991782|nr:AmmeMemoRadiSam system radical SAM enzyme [Prolixibacter sp. SD074]
MKAPSISRRTCIKTGLMGTLGMAFIPALAANDPVLKKYQREARYYKITGRGVKCTLCPNECNISLNDTGDCRTRINRDNKLYTTAYGNPCAIHIDPVEKKPLYHFLPGSRSFSIATAGCNLVCLNCQNWQISQATPAETRNQELFPGQVVASSIGNNCQSIAYTYAEPLVFYEYMYDSSEKAHQEGIKNILISNGYVNEEPLRKLTKVIDAANIDLKSFSDDIYIRLNTGSLKPVLRTLKILKEEGVWLEITNLVIPGWTDDMDMIKEMCAWLVKNGFDETPLHFSRFFPQYKLQQLPATPAETLTKARNIAMQEGIKFVYIGNLPGNDASNTLCPKCHQVVIERKGFRILKNNLTKGKCQFCHTPVPGVWA